MSKEAYVSFECAKLLKEKGFDWSCPSYWCIFPKGDIVHTGLANFANHNGNETNRFVSRPTQQMACRWLREEHNIHVVPKKDFFGGDYTGRIYDGRRDSATVCDDYIAIVGYDSYEAACEAAIKYVLTNLI